MECSSRSQVDSTQQRRLSKTSLGNERSGEILRGNSNIIGKRGKGNISGKGKLLKRRPYGRVGTANTWSQKKTTVARAEELRGR